MLLITLFRWIARRTIELFIESLFLKYILI